MSCPACGRGALNLGGWPTCVCGWEDDFSSCRWLSPTTRSLVSRRGGPLQGGQLGAGAVALGRDGVAFGLQGVALGVQGVPLDAKRFHAPQDLSVVEIDPAQEFVQRFGAFLFDGGAQQGRPNRLHAVGRGVGGLRDDHLLLEQLVQHLARAVYDLRPCFEEQAPYLQTLPDGKSVFVMDPVTGETVILVQKGDGWDTQDAGGSEGGSNGYGVVPVSDGDRPEAEVTRGFAALLTSPWFKVGLVVLAGFLIWYFLIHKKKRSGASAARASVKVGAKA